MSVFLAIPEAHWVACNAHAFAIRDSAPVSPGHTLVITRRLVVDWFHASDEERAGLFELVDEVKTALDAELHPDGYNVGFNAGDAAGQTVMHLHVHVIPRYRGDMDDPTGGVRHVIPSRGNYLARALPLATGGEGDPFAAHIFPLFDRADDIAIVAAFVQGSGIERIRTAIHSAVQRGATVRLVTGDYLDITQASALATLLDWQRAWTVVEDGAPHVGTLETRVVEVANLPGRTSAFHPKSWRFASGEMGVAFVGSSNLSRSALDTGIEWNLRVDRDRDRDAYDCICEAFERTWEGARCLDAAWVHAYAQRARTEGRRLPASEVPCELPEPVPSPHEVQVEALAKLRACRGQGRRRALVVLATGLGKTWLAAFDYRQLREEMGCRPRLLFLAHRREILQQAADAYRRLVNEEDPGACIGWSTEDANDLGADLVFASVAKLARPEHLATLRRQHFDYVVVDEVHHATAASYRRILDVLTPRFLLGLTATPDRADEADVAGLFDDFIAYRADVARGIALGRLTPFHYFGVKDDIDYENIPWRNRRFDPEALALAAQTEARMATLWRAWTQHPGGRTLVFCCSIAHANHVRDWLRKRGVRVAAVYSAAGSDDRDTTVTKLGRGEIDAVCAVDVFNEGLDIPSIDRVVMLRPTESSVIFLQQLGRGLRACEGKSAVTVVDFVGNHRVFLHRMRALLALAGSSHSSLRAFLGTSGAFELLSGCAVALELEAKQLLTSLFKVGGAEGVEGAYRELRLERGERPTAGELQRRGYLPSRLRERHGSWFEFVRDERDLDVDEQRALLAAGAFLRDVETAEMTNCLKMVALAALVGEDADPSGSSFREAARRSHALLQSSPELLADVVEGERVEELTGEGEERWTRYWQQVALAVTRASGERRGWLRARGDRLTLDVAVDPPIYTALTRLTRELVDYRLAQYRTLRRRDQGSTEGFIFKVIWNKRDPILKLPDRSRTTLPMGESEVRLHDGEVWQFRFMKEFCNVARPAGAPANRLPDLLRGWFGLRAGEPGTAFEVRFHATPDGMWIEPVQARVTALPARRSIVAYPDLPAAAGHALDSIEPPRNETVWLPIENDDPNVFAVRVVGRSMDGGKSPLHSGDWAVLRLARGTAGPALVDRVVLVQVPGQAGGSQYQIKRLRKDESGWRLTSDNPQGPTFPATEEMTVIARLEHAVHPEDLAPAVGSVIEEAELSTRFALEDVASRSGRHQGHLFVFIDTPGLLTAPDRLRYQAAPRRAGETAFVLAKRADGGWRYLGVARQLESEGEWALPEADFATWRAWGEGREVSRRLPDGALARAQLCVTALLELPDVDRWLVRQSGARARLLGAAQRGGLRVDGGEDGFAERTVSLQDIAWAIVASDDVGEHGRLLDEERLNRVRYLEGTPKGSTRWIDSGWALAAWALAKILVRAPDV